MLRKKIATTRQIGRLVTETELASVWAITGLGHHRDADA
jgi:hypothetical protein